MWERMGAHGELHAVFESDPPQEIIDEMDDVDDVLSGDMWNGGNYIEALRRRRGSKSVSEMSGAAGRVWNWQDRRSSPANGFSRWNSMREEPGPSPADI